MLKVKSLTEQDCKNIEAQSQGMISFEWADGIKTLKVDLEGFPPVSFSNMYGILNGYQQVPTKSYKVEWARTVDNKVIEMEETFEQEYDRANFIAEHLQDLNDDEVCLTEVEFY